MSPEHIPILLAEADAGAKRLVRKLRLPRQDYEDIRQDLLLDLMRRMPGYAPQRGTPGAFAGVVISHSAGRLARRIVKERGRPYVSFDDASSNSESLQLEVSHCPFDAVERRLGIQFALQRFDPVDRALCSELIDCSPAEIDRNAQRKSRATLYRQIRDIRLRLMLNGVSAQG